jgi:cytochrome c-type biogenesis protein CcmF
MGIGPLVAWRRASLRSLGRTFVVPATVALAAGAVLLGLGAGSSRAGMIAYTFSAFVAASIVLEFVRGTRARRALGDGSWVAAFASLVGRNRRRYGGYVVHAAVVLLAIGVAGSSAYQSVSQGALRRGQSMRVGGYTLSYRGLLERPVSDGTQVRAVVDVRRGDRYVATLTPGKNHYRVEAFFSTETAIRTNWLTGEDIYLTTDEIRNDGSIYLKAYVKPLVNLIWLGGFVFVLGSLVAMWPDAVEQRRLAGRYAALVRRSPTEGAPA